MSLRAVPDVADLVRDGALPADVAQGAVPFVPSGKRAANIVTQPTSGLPSEEPSERELLAAILWSGAYGSSRLTTEVVADLITDEKLFVLPAHRVIWEACSRLTLAGKPATPVAVHSELVHANAERVSGGLEYLDALVREAKPATDKVARVYAQTIRDAWIKREIIHAAEAIAAHAKSGKKTVDVVEHAVGSIGRVAGEAVAADASLIRLNKAIGAMIRDVVAGNKGDHYPTGFRDIDDIVGGLFVHETTVLAARTSIGKTTLAVQIAENIVVSSGNKLAVFYVSLEMKAKLFAGRIVAGKAGVPAQVLRRHQQTSEQFSRVMQVAGEIGENRLYFVDSQTQSIMSIHNSAKALRKLLAEHGIKLALIVIDHIGLVKPSPETARQPRVQQVAEASRGLRFLATEHDCHVMALAQINREGAKRGGKAIPQVHEIRDCGNVEEDADNIFILHRDKDDQGIFIKDAPAKLAIAKSRSGETGIKELEHDAEFVRFSDWCGPPMR